MINESSQYTTLGPEFTVVWLKETKLSSQVKIDVNWWTELLWYCLSVVSVWMCFWGARLFQAVNCVVFTDHCVVFSVTFPIVSFLELKPQNASIISLAHKILICMIAVSSLEHHTDWTSLKINVFFKWILKFRGFFYWFYYPTLLKWQVN